MPPIDSLAEGERTLGFILISLLVVCLALLIATIYVDDGK